MEYIQLTSGQKTIVDDKDYKRLMNFKWFASKDGMGYFAARWKSKNEPNYLPKNIRMSREILNIHDSAIKVSHKDKSNILDNRRNNLKVCLAQKYICFLKSPNKNALSKYKGVYHDNDKRKRVKRWAADISCNKKRYRLGRFLTEEGAAITYDFAAERLFGEYAWLNKSHFKL
jgi:hypothetical protein